jgi:hypothetical protein
LLPRTCCAAPAAVNLQQSANHRILHRTTAVRDNANTSVMIGAHHASAVFRREYEPSRRESARPFADLNQRSHTVSRHSSPIDERPFQPKAKLEHESSLLAQYGKVAIQDVAEALHHLKPQDEQPQPAKTKLSNAA